jgi:hypothetical protein
MIYKKIRGSLHAGENFLEILADKKLTIQSDMYEYMNRNRSRRYALGGLFSRNMKELGEIAKDLADSARIKKNLQLAVNADGRSNFTSSAKKIQEAKKEVQAILDKITDKNLRAYHPLRFIMNLPDTADRIAIDNAIASIDSFTQSRTVRSVAIHAVNTNQLRNQAQAALNLPSTHPSRIRMRKAGSIV